MLVFSPRQIIALCYLLVTSVLAINSGILSDEDQSIDSQMLTLFSSDGFQESENFPSFDDSFATTANLFQQTDSLGGYFVGRGWKAAPKSSLYARFGIYFNLPPPLFRLSA